MKRELSKKLATLEQELDDVCQMDEEAVAFRYNGATKEDIISCINQEIHKVEEEFEETDQAQYAGYPDPAFRNWEEVYRMSI